MRAASLKSLIMYLESNSVCSDLEYNEARHLPLYKRALIIQRDSYKYVLNGGRCRLDYIRKHLTIIDCPACAIDNTIGTGNCYSCPLISLWGTGARHICAGLPGFLNVRDAIREWDYTNGYVDKKWAGIKVRIKMYNKMLKCSTLEEMQMIGKQTFEKYNHVED